MLQAFIKRFCGRALITVSLRQRGSENTERACCIFVGAAQTDALQLVAVPVVAILEAAIISIVACLLATAIPLHSIAKMSIVDSIETVE